MPSATELSAYTTGYCKPSERVDPIGRRIGDTALSPQSIREIVGVVEDIRDVIAIENTGQYKGHYHVLGGLISPMDGIGPSQLNIESLCDKAARAEADEIIAALSTTMEGDTTLFYLYKKINPNGCGCCSLRCGIAASLEDFQR